MLVRFCSYLKFANVVSLIALFVALGGGAYALTIPRNSIGSLQLKSNAVVQSKIKNGAITSSKVKDGSLVAKDFKSGQVAVGPRAIRARPDRQDLRLGRPVAVLGGTFPNPSFEAGINKLVPVAIVRVDFTGAIISEVHRLPVTGPPTVVQHTGGQGDYTMNFPGLTFSDSDAVVCQMTGALTTASGEIRAGPSTNFPGSVFVGVATSAGSVLDRAFQCLVYDL